MNSKIVSITDLRRNFGELTSNLHLLNSLILTKGGEPFAILRAIPEVKKKLIMKSAGSWKNTDLDSDLLWKSVFKKRSRKFAIKL